MRTSLRAVVTGAMLTLLAGCSGGGGTENQQPTSTLGPRPVSVAADRIAPCTMLDSGQASRLGLERPTPGQAVVDGLPSPGCTWLSSGIDVNVQYIPVGADVATSLAGSTITRVNGFGAVRNVPDQPGPPICQLAVDVAPGQTIRVQASPVPTSSYGMEELCRRADEAASMVMTTVVATAPR